MTSTVAQATATFIRSTAHTATVGIIVVVLLLVLLVERELLRAHDGRRAQVGAAAVAIPIAPLVLACAVTMALRVTPLLYPTPAAHAPAHVGPARPRARHVRPAPDARGAMGGVRQRPGGRRPTGRSSHA
jgi:hypothetical protein